MNNINWTLIYILLWVLWCTLVLIIIRNYYRKLLLKASSARLKESADKLKEQRTLYETNIVFAYTQPSKLTKYEKKSSKGYCRLQVKEGGLLIKPFLINSFGLDFENILSIIVEDEKDVFKYAHFITIISAGNAIDNITFRTDKDMIFLDELRRCYKGEIIGHENI